MNYLEHETQVKFVDGLLAQSQDWQWLIDKLQERFEIKEIDSWDEYISESVHLRKVFAYFVKILGVCDKEWIFSKSEFKEIWAIAKFYIGGLDVDDCIKEITSNQCKILFFCVWITKQENGDNGWDYLYDIRLLNQRNYFQIIKCDSILAIENRLMDYAQNIPILGMNVPLQCLHDNLNQIEYPSNIKFLQKCEKEILNYNTFSYQLIEGKMCQTWQEAYLLDMLKVSFKNRNIEPMFSSKSNTNPDISMWTEKILYKVKKHFDNMIANFVVDTILYVAFNIEPSRMVKILHCNFLMEAIEQGVEKHRIFSSSSYQVLSYLQKDRLMQDCNREASYIKLLHSIQTWKDPSSIISIKEDGYPISKDQQTILSEFYKNKFKEIDNVHGIIELLSYLKDEATAKQITTEYLQKVSGKFKRYTDKNTDNAVPLIFYAYMLFLINVSEKSQNVNKRYVQKEMLQIQKVWQYSVYKKQCENMYKFSYQSEIKNNELEQFSDISLLNPIIFAKNCIPCSENEILNVMIHTSKHPFIHLCSSMLLNPIFPIEKNKIIYERHDIDKMLLQYVDELKNRKGYKLLNQFDSEVYVADLHERYRINTTTAISFFIKEEDLYKSVKEKAPIDLLPYSPNTSLALLTQLFPVLEVKIRELVSLFGIFPFKKSTNEFMKYNDPSSLLRELLKTIYEEQHSFENVPDLLYVYNIMYNSNSCNVRNECIHGRDYLYGSSLRFAFRATLFSIHMIEFRIKTIKENISDIFEIMD